VARLLIPGLYGVFLWWFATGAIIYLDLLPRWTFKQSFAAYSALAATCLVWLTECSRDVTPIGAYAAFTASLLVWGWFEISFYMGFVTGPRAVPVPPGSRGFAHFMRALGACLWHELAIVAGAALIAAVTWGAPNKVGLWTFLILWLMHESARLNVLLGVRNVAEEFVPDHLVFLRGFLRRRRMNPLFPFSVGFGIWLVHRLAVTALAPDASRFATVGLALLATLTLLALIEHVFLMLPLNFAALWRWSLSARDGALPLPLPTPVWHPAPSDPIPHHASGHASEHAMAAATGGN
jgi:putative photosynthetic complex assembly protein 2